MPIRTLRRLTTSALFLALATILPLAFHQFGIAGRIFLPMHWPVVAAGFLVGPFWGGLVGALSPAMGFLVSGFPRPPSLLLMTPEMFTYGFITGLLSPRNGLKSWRQGVLVLIPALVGGRLVYGIAATIFGPLLLGIDKPWAYIGGAMLSGIPGIIIMLVLLPPLIIRIQRAMPGVFTRSGQPEHQGNKRETKKIP
jgi:niacin transporter